MYDAHPPIGLRPPHHTFYTANKNSRKQVKCPYKPSPHFRLACFTAAGRVFMSRAKYMLAYCCLAVSVCGANASERFLYAHCARVIRFCVLSGPVVARLGFESSSSARSEAMEASSSSAAHGGWGGEGVVRLEL